MTEERIFNFVHSILLLFLGFLIIRYKSYSSKKGEHKALLEDIQRITQESELGKNLATKADVEDITKKIESVKNEFDLNKIRYQIQFAKLHDKRMVVIEDIVDRLARLQSAMEIYTAPMIPIVKDAEKEAEERLSDVMTSYNDFRKYYPGKKIFFSNETNLMLDLIIKHYWDSLWNYTDLQRMRNMGAKGEQLESSFKKAEEARKAVNEEIPIILEKLSLEFKKMMGVDPI